MARRISEFDIWRPGYGGAVVSIYVSGTTTLASVFLDEDGSSVASNPQILSSRSDGDGVIYGKFSEPLYVETPYYLSVNGVEETGIERPGISTLVGQDASKANVNVTWSSYAVGIADACGRVIHASNFGALTEGDSGSAATNTATIELSIAALTDGGEVVIPAGTYKVNSFSVPEGVIICGQGKHATTLQSIMGDASFTMTGNRAGFRKITLDGSNLTTGSVGVYSVGKDEVVFNEVKVKRFETGIHFKGGKSHVWTDFSIENTETGAKLHGDTNAGGGGGGDAFEDLLWDGGIVSVCSTAGLDLSYYDAVCHNLNLNSVGFDDNTGTAVKINGAQFISMNSCWWDGNTINLEIEDDTDPLTPATELNNKVISVRFYNGRMNDGEFNATGTCQEVILNGMKLTDVEFTLNTPILNFVHLIDCTETSGVTISGESTKFLRQRTTGSGESYGLTTSNTATKAWGLELQPGQLVHAVGRVIGKQRNGTGRAIYHIEAGAYRPGSTLAYDTQTANFTVGNILTGASSGATARIIADSDSGTTGTLTLSDISGEFIDNEIITDSGSGSATANGALSHQNVTLDGVGVTSTRTAYETDSAWACVFASNGPELQLNVTGNTSATVEWTANVDVVTT